MDDLKNVEKCCGNCEFCYTHLEEEWDEEEDYYYDLRISSCRKKKYKKVELDDKACKDYVRYKPESQVEQFTECDECDKLQYCQDNAIVIETTRIYDNFTHYNHWIGCVCPKKLTQVEPTVDGKKNT